LAAAALTPIAQGLAVAQPVKTAHRNYCKIVHHRYSDNHNSNKSFLLISFLDLFIQK
jgi:hypothetical protein